MTTTETGGVAGPTLPPGRHVDVPGRGRMFVREVAGPPGAPTIVLLHGLSASADLNWFPVFAPLGARYRVLAVDHRGHGRGIRSRRAFRLADCADDVAALCRELGVEKVIAVGYSMGGPIAQLLWHRHRDLVDGLVLCATSRDFSGSPRERAFYTVLPGVSLAMRLTPGLVRRRVGRRVLGDRAEASPMEQWLLQEFRRANPAAVAEAAASLGRFTSRDWIGEVDVPTAVVVTTRDQLVPPHRQRKLAEAIPGATVHECNGDHGVCVMSPRRFIPPLMQAVHSVVQRSRARV